MNHMIVLNNTECLLVSNALSIIEKGNKYHVDDRILAGVVRDRIHNTVNMDFGIEKADQLRNKYSNNGGIKNNG